MVKPNPGGLPGEDTIFGHKVNNEDRQMGSPAFLGAALEASRRWEGRRRVLDAVHPDGGLDAAELLPAAQNFGGKRPCLLVGGPGAAKTVTIDNFLMGVGFNGRLDPGGRGLMAYKTFNSNELLGKCGTDAS
eukprot:TRINITY_DN18446_c0_g2_i1.p3 TRINITY_DN18446_c0_g2~~TRINITY_DN18446_c0_g2_i1.p3  ORF type:complete len:132 (+),score=11.52 TRINITY_DN18446_c0_g2_i1:102-497(+)